MKKFVALLLVLFLALTIVPSAFAAEDYSTDNSNQTITDDENGRTFESVRVALASDGKLACIKTLKESYSSLKGYNKEEIENISSILKTGGILRAKGLVKGSLDELQMFADGSTSVQLALEVVNLEELQLAVGDGVEINAVVVMDAASIAHDGHIGHRAIDRPQNLVAKFYQRNGTTLFVYYDEFDGAKKLVFDAEAVNGGQQPSPNPAPEQPAPEQKPAPEQPAPEQGKQEPDPKNDPVVLPWESAPVGGTTTGNNTGATQNSPEPAPENDPVNLPW